MSKCKSKIRLLLSQLSMSKEVINRILLTKKNLKLLWPSLKKEEKIGGEESEEILM